MTSTCTICCDVFEEPRFLSCAHTFCTSCLDSYLNSSSTKGHIVCPLCRIKTPSPQEGASRLFENFFAAKKTSTAKISPCGSCKQIYSLENCSHCNLEMCRQCIDTHMLVYSPVDDLSDEQPVASPRAPSPDSVVQTYHHVNLLHSFNVSGDEIPAGYQINIKNLLPLNNGECLVNPNGTNVLITHHVESGVEIDRRYYEVDVVAMTMGVNGYPLVIANRTNNIYECRTSGVERIANTGLFVPFTLAALNNGRFAVLSATSLGVFTNSTTAMQCGVLQIFGMSGEVYTQTSDVNGEYKMLEPRDVCVNLSTNDIYVADYGNFNLQMYRENGNFVASYFDTFGFSALFSIRYIFPFACCYDNVNNMVLASDSHGRVRVLSPDLVLLGTLRGDEPFGIPEGLQCDLYGNIFMGDAITGRMRVYKMTEFSNKLEF